jgi:hypothetical protein
VKPWYDAGMTREQIDPHAVEACDTILNAIVIGTEQLKDEMEFGSKELEKMKQVHELVHRYADGGNVTLSEVKYLIHLGYLSQDAVGAFNAA